MSLSTLVKNSRQLLGGTLSSSRTAEHGPAANVSGECKKLMYCHVLAGDDAKPVSGSECARAWKQLQKSMALVPAGSVQLTSQPVGANDEELEADHAGGRHVQMVDVGGCYIDRLAVTCAEYSLFLRAGGYNDMSFWPNEIWPHVVQFVDQSGAPGPRDWRGGRWIRDQHDHPVTGICWYEANAYAQWIGKSLPTSAQWQRAGTWNVSQQGLQNSLKYPWGDVYEARHANLWPTGVGSTVAVNSHFDGCTPNGVFQLIGNTWEWTNDNFVCPGAQPMNAQEVAEIRGGAFDTYLPSQATCQFRSGQPKLYRGHNIGFRCCISINQIKRAPGKVMD